MATRSRCQAASISRPAGRRGFTMVELLAVVAMIGILAALAITGYRKYITSAKIGSAKDTIGAIRIAEESHRAETLSYLSCSSSLSDWYPATPNGKKRHWVWPSHPSFGCWQILNVPQDTPTTFGFAVVAGQPGQMPPPPDTVSKPTWTTPTEPWYVIQAAGDNDEDTQLSLFVASSFNGEIYVENESE